MYRVLVAFTRPYLLFHLCFAAILVYLSRRRRVARRWLVLIAAPWAAILIVSTPLCSYLMLGSLEWQYPPRTQWPSDVQAIVVLAGDLRRPDARRSQAELGPSTIYRCLLAAEIYQSAGPLPVFASGGKVEPDAPGPACAVVMSDFLQKLGVADSDIVVEDRSRTTHENAIACRELLAGSDKKTIVLVTDATHMRRALGCFRRQGIDAVPAPSNHRATGLSGPLYHHVLPSASALEGGNIALHEWLGIVWYRLQGRL